MTFGCFAGYVGFDCSILWIIMILLFFIAAIARRQITDFLEADFNLITATAVGVISFVVMMYVLHSFKWGFLVGLIFLFVGGFLGGKILGGEDEWGYG
jgi:hypothetical protein